MSEFVEFDGIEEMSRDDRIVYLLNLAERYNAVVKEAKALLEQEEDYVKSGECSVSNVGMRTRTTRSVDNAMLSVAYTDIYEQLFKEGKLYAKEADLKDLDPEIYNNIVSEKTSEWIAFCN